jgi:hypothetical protein
LRWIDEPHRVVRGGGQPAAFNVYFATLFTMNSLRKDMEEMEQFIQWADGIGL